MRGPANWRLLLVGCLTGAVALALAGCGEIGNTITAIPGTADPLTVALPARPNAIDVGIYEARALGYFRQADLDVRFVTPTGSATADQLPALEADHAQVALSSEPAVLAARDQDHALVSVAAVVQGPLTKVAVVKPAGSGKPRSSSGKRRAGSSGSKHSSRHRTQKPRTRTVTDTSLLPPSLQQRTNLPAYDGLVIVVRKATIVNDAPLLRRFVQAVARGYEQARSDPAGALGNLIAAAPELAGNRAAATRAVARSLASFFPTGGHPWGWQAASEWNAFGTWMAHRGLITNPNATPDASTNELLAGQGL